MFSSSLGPQARKFLKRCEKDVRLRIEHRIEALEHEPYPSEVERVQSLKGRKAFRVRAGHYRIQYVVYPQSRHVLVFKIKKRDKAY